MKTALLSWIALPWALAALPCAAQAPALPRIEQHLGAQLPLEESFIDDDGRAKRLAQLVGGKPLLLVPGYYRCPNLCSTVFQGVMQALAASDLPAQSYRLLAVSIDPADDATSAASKKAAWMPLLGRQAEAHFLSAPAQSTRRVLDAAGWQYRYDPDSKQYVHPAGMMILTPQGRIARYFPGLRFDPRELRSALQSAGEGQTSGFAEQLWLLCGHEGLLTGRYSAVALNAVRLACLSVLLLGLAWLWRVHLRLRLRKGGPR